MDVEKFLRFCLEKLVDNPQAVAITRTASPEKIVFEVVVDPADRARVIGREGRTCKALKALINIPLPADALPHELVIETVT